MVTVARSSRSRKTDLVVVVPRDGGDGFARFYNTERAGQVRRAALLIGDRDDARDLGHDAFIEVYRRWDELAEPGPYLNRVVLNRCRDRARHAARLRRAPVVGPVAGLDVVDDSIDDEGLWAALQRLPFNHRAVIYQPGEIETLWVVDIDGTLVVISTGLWPGPAAADHADFAAAVLESIRIARA